MSAVAETLCADTLPADDPVEVAEEAGLDYVSDEQPGLTRRRRGRGFSYHRPDGTAVRSAADLERIRSLAVPPAWTDVWICANPRGHLQATGRDAKGRKQYRYHPRWREVRDENKLNLLPAFGHALPSLRDRLDAELRQPGLSRQPGPSRQTVLAVVVKLLDETLVRVGNQEYASDNETYGLTTVTGDHVEVGWRQATFEFTGKGGIEHRVVVDDGRLARIIGRCHELGGQSLFSYDEDGEIRAVTSTDVNEYLRATVGPSITAKHFRTWGGTVTAAVHLGPLDPPATDKDAAEAELDAIDAAAAQLRNTRAVCRRCYVHPGILDAYRDGALAREWKRTRTVGQLSRGERTVLAVLDDAG
jgi:DNA topoisomerase-1